MANIYDDGYRVVRRAPEKTATKGGAHAFYEVEPKEIRGDVQRLDFQYDTIPDVGVYGWTNEAVLAVVIDRLEGFQASEFACDSNRRALEGCRVALNSLEERTAERKMRGVEGKHEA